MSMSGGGGGVEVLGAVSSDSRTLQHAQQGAAQDNLAIYHSADPVYSLSNNLATFGVASPYVQDVTQYLTYNNPLYKSPVGDFDVLDLDLLFYLTGGSASATATLYLQRLLADSATWLTFLQEQIAAAAAGVTSYAARLYTIGAGVPQLLDQAAGTQTISVNGVNQTFTTTASQLGADFGLGFRWQIVLAGAGAVGTLFNASLVGRT